MDTETKKILDKQTELMEENNSMLRKIRRAQVAGTITWALKWIIILGAAFGFYYQFQPTILRLFEVYDSLLQNVGGVNEVLNSLKPQN